MYRLFQYDEEMDAKKTIAKLRGESDRKKTSLYLSESLLKKFGQVIYPMAPSRVVEELIREFLASIEDSPAKAKKSKKKI